MLMNKYAVFTGSCLSAPAIEYLDQAGLLACVVLPDSDANPDLLQLQQWLEQKQITMLKYNKKDDKPLIMKLDRMGVECGVIYLFRHKIKTTLIQYFQEHLVNIHPSPLPDYRGPQPIYWQLRNGESSTKLTLHKVNEELDCGDIGCEVEIDIHPFETNKCLHQKMAQALPYLVSQFVQTEQSGGAVWRPQEQGASLKAAPQIIHSDLLVDWRQHSAREIANMARAGNTDVACALFQYRQSVFQLLQATPVECNLVGVKAGTVVQLDKNAGLVVKTDDCAVRLDIIGAQQGVFDGYRFALLFSLEPGMELCCGANYESRVI
tara:strand:- start:694 stop:1656 length:963 start_codon:yes stop_codon:yes gene_type:complete